MDGSFLLRGSRAVMTAATVALMAAGAVACGGGDGEATPTQGPGEPTATPTGPSATPTDAPTPTGVPDAPEFRGVTWRVTDYVLATGTITNIWPDTEVTLTFDADGSVRGSGGCNQFGARYEVEGPYDPFEAGVRDPNDGQAIRITELVATEMACSPSRVMTQEQEVFDHLLGAGRWVIIRGEFHLRGADGGFLLQAEPSP